MQLSFDPQKYGTAVTALLADEPLCELGPARPIAGKRDALSALNAGSIADGQDIRDRQMAQCCVSGLWLLFNFLDESHTISQDIPSGTGSYWHGIMHRREPDFSNGKYWFRRVGEHPVFEPLCQRAGELAETESLDGASEFLRKQARWDPFQFIDLCESVARGRSSAESLCRRVAQEEWRLLFDYCYEQALGNRAAS